MMVMVQDAVMQWRTYDCFMPHCNDGLMIVFCHLLLLHRWFIRGLCCRALLLLLVFGPLGFCAWSVSTGATKVNFS